MLCSNVRQTARCSGAPRRSTDPDGALVTYQREFTALFVDQASRKPTCPAAEMVATGMLEEIAQAPFDS
jgi:hypothetical protein